MTCRPPDLRDSRRAIVVPSRSPPLIQVNASLDSRQLSYEVRLLWIALIYLKRTVTPPTAADTSAPTFGPLSCKITPLAFCN
jgi:hypothetical protein